jgi:hypothetical protein
MCKKCTIQIDKIAGEYVATLWEGVKRIGDMTNMQSKCLEHAEAEAVAKWPQAVQVNGIDVTIGEFFFGDDELAPIE